MSEAYLLLGSAGRTFHEEGMRIAKSIAPEARPTNTARRKYLGLAILLALGSMVSGRAQPDPANLAPTPIVTNRPPLAAVPFVALPLGSVRPEGWLLTQCQEQREGLTGNAERIYAGDLGTNSAWLGGSGESWERGPYYFKGLVALAYTLNDEGLKRDAQKWMDWLLEHQGSNGYLGPLSNNDWWPRMVATYALRDYYEATADSRVPVVLSNYFNYMRLKLPGQPLTDWGKARAGDEMDVALWLFNRNGDTNLLSVVKLLRQQAYDWPAIFAENKFDDFGKDFHPKHNVNVQQALKMPVVYYRLSRSVRDANAIAAGLANLMREHALPCDINSGTEFLAGNSTIQGVELCAVVEAMLSLETSARILGDPTLADRLETVCFNALPAALANHIKGLQYYVLANNVTAIPGGHGFNQDYRNGTLPGPESGYPCCRYNCHMGWPKFVQNSWAATSDGGLAIIAYAPTVVNAMAGGQQVQIRENTSYPFAEEVQLQISVSRPVSFPLVLRIPGWCTNAMVNVNGEPQPGLRPGSFYRLMRTWTNGDSVAISLPMVVRTLAGPSRSVAITRGPLVYSLKIGENWTTNTPDPAGLGFDEFQVHASTPWAYALQLNPTNPAASFTCTSSPTSANPFDPAQPSVALIAQGCLLTNWTIGWRGTHAFEPPVSPVAADGPLQKITLVPFGSQHLRVSWFPHLGTPAPVSRFFREEFDESWCQRWTTFGGNWIVHGGVLSTVPGSANGAKALAMASAFTNFTFEADVAVGSDGNAGVVFRASQPDIGSDAYCGYYAGIDARDSNLQCGYANNDWHPLATCPMTFVTNAFYHLTIHARGPRLEIYVNHAEKPAVVLQDSHFAGGMIGVRDYCSNSDNSLSRFSNLEVRED